jgi:DNA topoisomerase-1
MGLITYMRTDSVHLANEAVQEIRQVIKERYSNEDVPSQPRQFKTKSKNAQEAHEAIRPTSAQRYYEDLKKHLSVDQYKLYELIWKRTIACQMIHATLAVVAVDLACGEGNCFRATGSTVLNPGFMKVYQEGLDDKQIGDDDEKLLPQMVEGEWITLKDIRPEQHFTEPPPRFSEATLVKRLEELGIGRPSTYAAIISTLQQREYVLLDKKRFTPTDVGRVVNTLLTEHFDRYVDYGFTARLEDDLDAISRGEQPWLSLLEKFWGDFKSLVDQKMQSVRREDITQKLLDEKCPECGKQLSARLGKRGNFIGCSGYPECSYTRDIKDTGDGSIVAPAEVLDGRNCPLCNSALHIKQGRYSKFIGCSNYPKCKFTESLEKSVDSGVTCPNCHKGTLVRKKSRFGTFFYSCSTYPDCKYAISNEPLAETCPKCQWPILMLKVTKRRGTEKVCPQKECDYAIQVALPAEKVETS